MSLDFYKFSSTPENATVYLNEVKISKTPMEKKLKRNQEYYVKIELDGYKPYNTNISKGFNVMVFGNLIFGGIIGIIIDASTGSMHTLNPKVINPL